MPMVDVEVVFDRGNFGDVDVHGLAGAIGAALGSSGGSTWVRLRYLPADQYGENGEEVLASLPVFVQVLKARMGGLIELKSEAQALTAAVAQFLGRPESSVHVVYEPEGTGRVAFGGTLVVE